MKRIHWMLAGLLCFGVLFAGVVQAKQPGNRARSLAKIANDVKIDVNNISMFVTNSGSFGYDIGGGSAGLEFPKGTGRTAVFAAGLWVGGKVNDEIRVAIAEFSNEYEPGPILADGTPADPLADQYRVYKIKRGDDASNPDYAAWPVADGAPVDENGDPLVLGDQTLWSVYNDGNAAAHSNMQTDPLGIEVQQTTFGFDRSDALGNIVFIKYKVINKGGNRIDSTYVSIWVDPDLGQFDNDLVGCDFETSLGYCYNATNTDAVYGSAPPAVGFDFFQGPIGDDGVEMPMTSFNKYINGTDPHTGQETFNYMKGIDADGGVADHTDPTTGNVTAFVVAGDPVTGTGWIDDNPADRRLFLTAGPFTFAQGDTQEVVTAVITGQGKDRLTSVTALRFNDSFAQAAFDLGFQLPNPPPAPEVTVSATGDRDGNGHVSLTWDDRSEAPIAGSPYVFEGYNVYQGASISGPWTRIATFDVINGASIIFDQQFDANFGVVVNQPVQFGGDSGIKHYLEITEDAVLGGRLVNDNTYFFSVTAYSLNETLSPKTLENSITVLNDGRLRQKALSNETELDPGIVPRAPLSGWSFEPVGADSVVTHASGFSDGVVSVKVVDPAAVTGHNYEVRFEVVDGVMVWDLVDVTANKVVLDNQTQNTSALEGEANKIVDGLLVKAIGPPDGINDWDWSGSERWFSGVDWGASHFFGGLDIGANFFGSAITSGADFRDIEIRFAKTGAKQKAYRYLRGGDPNYGYQDFVEVPFTVWDVTNGANRQVNALFTENVGSSVEDGTWLPAEPDADDAGVGGREYLFIMASDYSDTALDTYTGNTLGGGAESWDILYAVWGQKRGSRSPSGMIDDGQIFHIIANKVNTTQDVFTFDTTGPTKDDAALAKTDLKKILAVPNPYYGRSAYELNHLSRIVKFTNLPANCTIRLFTMTGDLVRTIDHNSGLPFETWNLKTDQGVLVASGIYVAHIDAGTIGTKFIKLALFMESETLNTY